MIMGRMHPARGRAGQVGSDDARDDEDLVYVFEDGKAFMMRIEGDIFDNPFAYFTEWNSEADCKAFDKL